MAHSTPPVWRRRALTLLWTALSLSFLPAAHAQVPQAAAPRFAVAMNPDAATPGRRLQSFTVDAGTGTLTPAPGFAAAGDLWPTALAASRDGRFVFAATADGVVTVAVDVATGALTDPGFGPAWVGLGGASALALDPVRPRLYAGRSLNDTGTGAALGVLQLDAAGGFTWLVDTVDTGGFQASAVDVDPSGRFVYVLNRCADIACTGTGSLAVFAVDPVSLALTPVPGSPFATGARASTALAVHPSGQIVYVASALGVGSFDGAISTLAVDAAGTLSPVGAPLSVPGSATGAAIDPLGRVLVVTSGGGVTVFAIDPLSGALNPAPASFVVPAGAGPSAVAMDPSGRFVHVAVLSGPTGDGQIESCVLDAATGMLQPVPGGAARADQGTRGIVTIGAPSDPVAQLVRLDVGPASLSLPAGGAPAQLTATGLFSDGSSRFLTTSATWQSSDVSVIAVDGTPGLAGRAAPLAPGAASITATLSGLTGTASVTVTAPALVNLTIAPLNSSVPVGHPLQYTATGTFSDGSSADVTSQVTWRVFRIGGGAADFGAGGTLVGLVQGAVGIVASATTPLGTVSRQTGLFVTAPAGPVPPAILSAAAGTFTANVPVTQRIVTAGYPEPDLTVVGTLPPGVDYDVQARAFVGTPGATGVYAVTIGASNGAGPDASQTFTFTIVPPVLTGLMVNPVATTMAPGTTLRFTVAGIYNDGSQPTLSGAQWTSSSPSVATIDAAGIATGIVPGTTTITATLNGVTGSTMLEVAHPTALDVSPAAASVPRGGARWLSAVARFGNGILQDVTPYASWQVADPAIASVVGGGEPGGVRGHMPGQTTVVAALGVVTGQATLDVTAPVGSKFVFTGTPSDIGAITVDAYQETLTPAATPRRTIGGRGVEGAVADASGRRLYLAECLDPVTCEEAAVGVYDIDALTGDLTPVPGSPFAVGVPPGPAALVADPNGRFLHIARGGRLVTFVVDPVDGSLRRSSSVDYGQGLPVSLGSSPSGRRIYGATGNQLTTFLLDERFVALTPVDTISLPGLAAGLAVDPLGRVVAVTLECTDPACPSPGAVATFRIVAGSDALAAAPGSPADALGEWPGPLVFSADGSRLVVASQCAPFSACAGQASLTAFAVDPATAVLVPPAAGVLPLSGLAVTALAMAPSGRALYAVSPCADPACAGPGTLNVFAVDGAGALALQASSPHPAGVGGRVVVAAGAPFDPVAPILGMSVLPGTATIARYESQTFVAAGSYADGSIRFLTTSAAWSAADPAVATAAPGGVVTAVAPGATTVTAQYDGASGVAAVDVIQRVLRSVSVSPASVSVPLGLSVQLAAIGHYSDGSTEDLTAVAQWSGCCNVDVSASGFVTTIGVVSWSTVRATVGTFFGEAGVESVAPVPVLVEVQPSRTMAITGSTVPLVAIVTFSDGFRQDATALVSWTSLDPAIATVSATGQAQLLAQGTARFQASLGGATGVGSLPVFDVAVMHLLPSVLPLPVGASHPLKVAATLPDGSLQDITGIVTWTSSDRAVVDVSAAGRVTATKPGRVTITAVRGTVTATADVEAQAFAPKFVFALNRATSDIAAFAVDAPGGRLVPLAGAQVPVQPYSAFDLAADPAGAFLFVASSDGILTFSVDQATGALLHVAGPVQARGVPTSIAVDPTGRTVLVTTSCMPRTCDSGGVAIFAVDRATGALTLAPGAPVPSGGRYATSAVTDASGRFVFAANQAPSPCPPACPQSTGVLAAFGIDAGMSGGAYPIGTFGGQPAGWPRLTADPQGRAVYLASDQDTSAFRYDAWSGALTPLGTSWPGGGGSNVFVVDPAGITAYLSVDCGLPGGCVVHAPIDAATGALLTPGAPVHTPGVGFPDLAMDRSGRFLYVAHACLDAACTTGGVSMFAIDPATGSLTAMGPAVAAGGETIAVVTVGGPALPLDGGPSALVATLASATSVSLAWTDGSTTERGFDIERASGSGGFAPLAVVGADVVTYTDLTVAPGVTYTYRVRARNDVDTSAFTTSAPVAVPAPPAAPDGLTATVNGDDVRLDWLDRATNELGVDIERSVNGGPFQPLATLAADSTSYVDANLADGTYLYRVRATNAAGPSAFSAQAAAVVTSARTFVFGGFLQPVDAWPVANVVNAGRTVPVKWRLTLADGTLVADVASFVSLRSMPMACDAAAAAVVEQQLVTAGDVVPRFDAAAGHFIFNWKTAREWSGCRVLELRLSDGSTQYAKFRMR